MDGKLKQGEALFAEGKIQEAQECFLDLIVQYPKNHEILNNLGVISFARGDQKAAENYFLKTLVVKDDCQDALMNLNTIYQDSKGWKVVPAPLEKVDSAISFFREAQELFPKDYTLPGNLGFLLLKKEKFQQAEDALKRALELKPDYSDALYTIGKVYMAQGRFVEALPVLEACLSIDSSHEPARNALAECHQENTPAAARARYSKILIVMEEGLGNMVMLTPTIRALKAQLPEANITVLCREPSSRVIEGWNMVERVILQPDERSYDIGFLTIWSQDYQRRYGEHIREQCKTVYTIPMIKPDMHETDHHLRIARLFGYAGDVPDPFCMVKNVDLDLPVDKKLIGLSDTTLNREGWERKRWPYYRELAGRLLEKGYAVVLIGGQGEAERFNPKDWPKDVINSLGKYDVQETAGLLKKCHMFIGNDSGPAHMAAALGIPTLVLFGPTLVSKNKPFGREVEIVSRRLPCSPCQYTQRWEGCEDFRCMNEITVDHILARVTAISIPEIEIHAGPLQLVAKDYDEARLITEDNIKYVWENGIKEPLRIHLVGAGKANFPWGMENEIRRALELEGIEVIETDYRMELDNFANRFLRPAHIMLVCKGSGISPELIRQYPGTALLWYQDDVFTTAHAPRDLAFNGSAFDRVYFFDKSALEECRKYGIRDVHWLPLAMSPALHRKMYLAKKHDVSFVGNIHPNRKPFFERLQKRFNILVKQAFMDEMVQIFNQSKIVLNLGIGPTGIQQRIFEALACGSFLLTNEIPSDGHLFEDRKHLVYFNEQNIETLIAYYLEHEKERERIAYQGYLEAHAKHTFQHRIRQLLKKTFTCFEESSSTGVATNQARVAINKKGKRRLLVFWHGIGDNIMATPALRAFRETHRDDFIGYMYLKRIHKDELMNGCPYVDAVHTCSDAWDDYPDYEIGVKAVIEEAKQLASREGYDEVIPITMRTMPLTHHRIERIAYELGVPLSNWSTVLWISKEERKEADRKLSAWGIGTDDFIVAIHRRGANIHKYWEADEAQKVIDYLKAHYNAKVIAFETHTDLNREPTKQLKGVFSTADLGELPLKVSAALIDRCNLYIGLDSGPMWLATTTTTPLVALFTMTWMHQSAPLRANSVVVASDQAWQMANDVFKQRILDRIVHDPTGGTKIKAESVLQAITKLDLGLSEVAPQHDFNKQSITPSKPTLALTPPGGTPATNIKGTKKVLFVSWHGLGDNVMLTPALRKYKQQHPDTYIALAGLKRFGNTLKQLLSGLPFIDEVIPCLPDAWNDFADYLTGVRAVTVEARKIAEEKGFTHAAILPTNIQEGNKQHKILRFAGEVGVKFAHFEDLQTELAVSKAAEIRVEEYLKDYARPVLVLHTKAGNRSKILPAETVEQIISKYRGYSVLEFGQCNTNRSELVPEDDMEFSKALIKRADMVVATDSVVMHIAGAFRQPCFAIFIETPVHQAIPLTYDVTVAGIDNEKTALGQWSSFKRQILELFPLKGKSLDNKTDIMDFLKNCYSPVPFEGYQANAVRKEGSHKRWKAILPLLSASKSQKILDIGCNLGFFSFSAAMAGHKATGIDTDQKCIHFAKRIAKLENVSNVQFHHLCENLLDYLRNISDNEYDFVFYLSVHHHIYEQSDDEAACQVLWEISRIAKNVIFDMGQPDEQDSGWMPWLNLIPKFADPKRDIITYVTSNSKFQYGEIISSSKIHGTERWLYSFSAELPLSKTMIQFADLGYVVDQFIWRSEGSKGKLKSSIDSFPTFDPEAETKVRYYQVRNYVGKKFFVKEILYNYWLDITPQEAAQNEFDRGQKLLADKALAPHVCAPIALNRNFMLFEYIEWPNLFQYAESKLPAPIGDQVLRVAEKIRSTIGAFDFNPNNILYDDGRFKFIDFGYAECNWRQRKTLVKSCFRSVEDISNQSDQQTTASKTKLSSKEIRLPDFYHNPICYWAQMVTFRCNGGCLFCILNRRGKRQKTVELSGKQILSFWNNIEHRPGQRISLIGGEPTLHPDIVEIVNSLKGYHITLTTNCKGPFYEDPNFHTKFNPHPSSELRINTTFHPHLIAAEDYLEAINLYRKSGYFVDQTSYVYHPDIHKYQEAVKKVSKAIPIKAAPYLGFYDMQNQFGAPFCAQNIEPNESYYDLEAAASICGITDLESYRDICGQSEKRQVSCNHPFLSLVIGPEGNYYHCHYKLYYGIDPVSNIKNFNPVAENSENCRHYGFCNWCDVPRVGCAKNPTAQKMVLNKLYDKRETDRSEIRYLINEIAHFSKQHNLEFNPLKWFEYSYCLLYSGHRHRGKVLDVGSAKSVFPYYLSANGYDVTTIDIADSDYRVKTGKKFNTSVITGDLLEFLPELEEKFDLISNMSVIEHIAQDTKSAVNLARYLKPGGIMFLSTDFHERYIEYPDANRTIVRDRPPGSHTDSRVYTEESFLRRIILPLEKSGLKRLGLTDYRNVDIRDERERAVRGLYTFGIACLIKEINPV